MEEVPDMREQKTETRKVIEPPSEERPRMWRARMARVMEEEEWKEASERGA